MKQIIKGKEPISMLIYRKQVEAYYQGYREKEDLQFLPTPPPHHWGGEKETKRIDFLI